MTIKKNRKKAFASTIFAGLALLIIALSAAAVLSMQESEVNAKKLFQAKQTSWLYSDAQSVLENALYDAETDSAYSGYGCQTDVDVCTALRTTRNASAYLQNALANLSASTQNAALEIKDVTVTCTELTTTCAGGGAPGSQE
ncbi:hypothetical protein H0N96_02405, partial [Candidatus Micrarchaeota archaeon]|nr:hypothetical protein [Candidatus Micrarchaeota archaeon]